MIDKELEQGIARLEAGFRQIMTALEDINKTILLKAIAALRDGYPEHTIVSCGSIAESILKRVWIKENIKGNPTEKTLEPLMQTLKDNIEDRLIRDYLRDIQTARNRAAHGEMILNDDAVEVLRKLSKIINWYLNRYESPKKGDDSEQSPPPHVEPKPPPESVPPAPIASKLPIEPARPTLPVIQTIHGWSTSQAQTLQQQTAQALGLAVELRDTLKDNSQGPLMVLIPGGRFLMGSPADELERGHDECQHEVQVAVFTIGKYATTVGQFKGFVEATGYRTEAEKDGGCYSWTGSEWKQNPARNWRYPGFSQADNQPVVGVSWNDAMAYVGWLSGQTGQQYRLPTEAEWEYACRAGTTTPFHFGETISTDQANYNGNDTYSNGHKGIYRQKTVAVGQFSANAWGLHDMHGNVWEWTCSEYDRNYGKAALRCVSDPNSGRPRVLRGGSWYDEPKWLRGAARCVWFPCNRNEDAGFRLARTLPVDPDAVRSSTKVGKP
jgi:formylglycine-generating enzyme required for sulfatase activity